MAIEARCPGCNRLLRVADGHAGRQARCPLCQTIYTVPASGSEVVTAAATAEPPPLDEAGRWWMQTPDGKRFGPVSRRTLDDWVAQGRVSAECLLRQDEQDWRPAENLYAELSPPRTAPAPAAERPATSGAIESRSFRTITPHRGTLILILGILGWLSCPFFGLGAWILGSSDLRAMREGRMDPSGEALTQAGRVMGMIQTILLILGMIVSIFLMLAVTAA